MIFAVLSKALAVGLVAMAAALPDSGKTPGVTNPDVTQANIAQTICVSGFTKTIRPPSSYTTSLKIKQLQQGYAVAGDMKTSDYEEDHLISLELGGHPTDPRNLWPEPYAGSAGARVKDAIENKLHDLVCAGSLSLAAAQLAISVNWEDAYQKYIGALPATDVSGVTPNVTSGKPVKAKKLDPRFQTCKAANKAGYGPYFKGINKEYAWYRDANSDGKVC